MSPTRKVRVLVTDSHNRSALAATRALGMVGHDVINTGHEQPSIAAASKYSRGFEPSADPASAPAQFAADVARIVERQSIDVVLPMTEIATLVLAREGHSLPQRARMPFAGAEVVALAADKAQVLRTAQRLGVPTPRTVILESAEEARSATLEFPVVIKPARSRVWTGSEWLSGTVKYASTREELLDKLARMRPEIFPVLLQERIEGPGLGVFLCYQDGRRIAAFAHRRLREKPPSGGVSVLSESVKPDPVVLRHASQLLEAIQWRGVAMVEFKRDLKDGAAKIMEINGRFWGSLQLAVDAGVNFPALAVDIAMGIDVPPVVDYHEGVRLRWFLGDCDALLMRLTKSGRALNLPPGAPGRLMSTLRFLKFWGTRYEVLRFADPKPGLVELKRRLS